MIMPMEPVPGHPTSNTRLRRVGIDEAGYGPNLGPLVFTAVVAEGPQGSIPNLWDDHSATVCRVGGPADRLWIDDSKRLYRQGSGRDRLEAAALATLMATGQPLPGSLVDLLAKLEAGSLEEVELAPWLGADKDLLLPRFQSIDQLTRWLAPRPLEGAAWSIVSVRSVVVGPARFNRRLEALGSKASVHFEAFAELLAWPWNLATDGMETLVRSDKHGGRHFYQPQLVDTFPEAWIDRGPEGPSLSRYMLRSEGRRLGLDLVPRADAEDGLVALASIISKLLREYWMIGFNAYWANIFPGIRPTAGYPLDAARFRLEIEPECQRTNRQLETWWRAK